MADASPSRTGRTSTGSHIFAEFESLEGLNAPIRASSRIKYTSIGVCRRYIALGASTGGLYIFHRETLKYLQVLANKEGAVTKVAFAPDDNIVGFATSLGFVIAWELNIDQRDQPERLVLSTAHRNVQVTCLQWDSTSLRLFSGDNKGRVTQTNADTRKSSGFFKMPSELVLSADSPIVQLDFADEKVLVSAQTKCIICDTTKKQSYTVGKKPRDGQFGGCFLQRAATDFPTIYTGRPGSRIWEANIVGQVQATHQFKHLLAIPPLPVVGPSKQPVFQDEQKPQSFNFPVLLPMGSRFLLTWTDRGVFVFDPVAVDVVVWTEDIRGIVDVGSHKGQLYCLQENGRLHRYFMLTIERCIAKLFGQSLWEQCAQMCTKFASRLMHLRARRHVPLSLVKELNFQLLDHTRDLDLVDQLEDLVDRIESSSPGNSSTASSRRSSLESCDSVRLESGIYLIRNRHDSEDSFEDTPLQAGDISMGEITLQVPQSPYKRSTDVIQNKEEHDQVFPTHKTNSDTGFTEVILDSTGETQDAIDHDGEFHTNTGQRSHSLVESSNTDSSSEHGIDSESQLDSAVKVNASAMQTNLLKESSTNTQSTSPNEPNSTTMIHNQSKYSTNNEGQALFEEIQLDQKATQPERELDQSTTNTLTDNRVLTRGDDPLFHQPVHLEEDDIASCSGPRTTPSPEVAVGDSSKMPNWSRNSKEDVAVEEQFSFTSLEVSIDSDAISQDSVSLNDISASSQRQEPVPYSMSSSAPIPVDASSPSITISPPFGTSPPQDASPTRAAPPSPILRRTRSVPSEVSEAGTDALAVRRRLSASGTGSKERKKKKKRTRIVEIGDVSTRIIQSELVESPTETKMAASSHKTTPQSSDLPPQPKPSPVRSKSTPSSHTTPSPFSPRTVESSSSASALSPGQSSNVPIPRKVESSADLQRPRSWDNANPLWQVSAGILPGPQAMFVDLASPQKLNLPSVSESISAVKESLSSTLTTAKSFLLNKMDSKEELHHSVSEPAFNLYFPEEDRTRVERLRSLIQVGKEQRVHPSVRGLVAATSVARSKLEDPAVLYSPSESRKVLEEWVQHLHAAVHKLYAVQPQLPPIEETSQANDQPDVPSSTAQLQSEPPNSDPQQSELSISDQPQSDTDIHENHTDMQEQPVMDKTNSVEEPLKDESGILETQEDKEKKDYQKGTEEKGVSLDTAITTTTTVNTSVRMTTSVTGFEHEKPPGKSSLPPSKGHRGVAAELKDSALGFLERLGSTGHSVTVFDDGKKGIQDSNVKSEEKTQEVQDDDLKMDLVPDLLHEDDHNQGGPTNDAIIANGGLTLSKNFQKDASTRTSKKAASAASPPAVSSIRPTRSKSDADLEHACYNDTSDEVPVKQTYCVKDPFSLPPEIHEEIGELTVMCFEMGIYGRLKKGFRNDSSQCDLPQDGETKSRTAHIFEVGHPNEEAEGDHDINDNASQSGTPFYVANHLLSPKQSEEPESDIKNDTEDSLDIAMETDVDEIAAEFIKEYFHFLDVAKLREVLCLREHHRKLSFEALIRCLQEKYKESTAFKKVEETGADLGVDHLKMLAQKSPGLELCFAVIVYKKSSDAGIEYMVKTRPGIRPWEVLDVMSSTNDRPARDYLSYVSGILQESSNSKRVELMGSICKETSIRLQLLQFALFHNAPAKKDLFCSCRTMPRPGSHLRVWTNKNLINKIIKLDASADLKEEMLQFCQQFGYWRGVMVLQQELNMRDKALRLAVQLGDIAVLTATKKHKWGIQPRSVEDWKTILESMSQLLPCHVAKEIEQLNCINCNCIVWPRVSLSSSSLKSNKSSDWSNDMSHVPEEPECDWSASESTILNSDPDWLTAALAQSSEDQSDWLPTVTWESIAVLLVRSVGAKLGVNLLREVKVPEGALSRQFHQACIVSAIFEKGQRTLSHTMLERVDTYLWSKRPTTMAPSLYQLVKNETKKVTARRPGEPASLEEQMELLGSFSLPEGEFHFLEEPDCHWGIHVNVSSNCSVCGVKFDTFLPVALQGVVVFSCGHAFHKLCIPEKACVLCFENKVSKSK